MVDPTDTATLDPAEPEASSMSRDLTRIDLTEAVLAAAIVLARFAGVEEATVSDAGSRWHKKLALPRGATVWHVLTQLGRVPGDAVTVEVTGVRHLGVTVSRPGQTSRSWWSWSGGDTSVGDLTARVRRVLRASGQEPHRTLRDLPVLTPGELAAHAVLKTPASIAKGIDVTDALRRHAVSRPHATAVVQPDPVTARCVTYAELEDEVALFAAGLRALGAGPASVVAFALPRSVELVVAILGALRAGIPFTALSPTMPGPRARGMLDDCRALFVVAQASWDLPHRMLTPTEVTAAAQAMPSARASGHERHGVDGGDALVAADTAYVLFTSGSTGRPKGAVIGTAALRGYVAAVLASFRLAAHDRVLQIAEPGFDVVLEEVLPTIASGACVVIADPTCLDSPESFGAFARAQGVSVINLPSSLWAAMFTSIASAPGAIRLVVVGSERVPAAAFHDWHATAAGNVRFVNAYGTTETTITSVVYDPDDHADALVRRTGSVPIGRPLANTSVRIVDAHGDPTPFGVPGELVVGGTSVFSGYLGARSTQREYHTGDLVVLDASGVLLHAGRLDAQVKIRGRRIEPAEVEAALEALSGVRRAVCTTVGSEENTRLVAVVVPGANVALDPLALRAELAGNLPEWLVPHQIALIAALPCNERGKADHAAIRALFTPTAAADDPPPDDPPPKAATTEEIVAGCVAALLGCPTPRASDSFFALGGNSVQAIRLVARLAKLLGTAVPARQVFATPTIAAIARAFDAPPAGAVLPIVRRAHRGVFPLTSGQRAMLRTIGSPRRPRPYFEMSEAFRIAGPLNRAALRHALRRLVQENEALRTVIDPAGTQQRVLPAWEPAIVQVDVSGLDVAGREAALEGRMQAAREPFDLTAEPAFRVVLVRLEVDVHVLLLTFHHLFFDGWSYGVCYERLGALYAAALAGGAAVGSEPISQPEFGDYAAWLTTACTDEVRAADIAYWRRALAGYRAPQLCQRLAPQCTSSAASQPIDAATTAAVDALATASAVTPFAVLYATFAVVLGHLLDHTDLLLASNDANRYQPGTEQMLGYLAVSQLSRIQLHTDDTFGDLARRAHATLVAARHHLSVQWEELVAELGLTNAVHVRFSLQDTPAAGELRLEGLDVQLLPERAERGGRRAVVVNVWRRAREYEVQWYSRDDLALPVSPGQALRMFASTLARVVVDADQRVPALQLALAGQGG